MPNRATNGGGAGPPPQLRPGHDAAWLGVPVVSWALYDLANTVFSMNITTLYLPQWLLEVGGGDGVWGYVNSFAALLLLLTAPVLSALSDQAGRRLPFLLVCTAACVGLTALLGTWGVAATLGLYVGANYFFNAGLIFYDATLPVVSTPENRGRVGGFGIGIGYLGSFTGVLTGILLLDSLGYVGVFRVTALLFALFAVPIFIFVREPAVGRRLRLTLDLPRRAFRQARDTFVHVRRYPGLARFLVGRVFYADAANTVIIMLVFYLRGDLGMSTGTTDLLMMVAITGAVAGGLVTGRIVDRIGPKRTLMGVLGLWVVGLSAAIAVSVLDLPAALFWAIAPLIGVALGGTWTADRPWMLELSPPDRVGEFYGLYGLVGRFAAVLGPALWALIADTLGFGRPAALASLIVLIGIAAWILSGVPDRPREAAL
ncbi:MAG: MFS transporter [Gemmatimonadetes bacterium]|nr:MFS transporter [Gemmatimonadota bacterium]